MSEAAPQFPPLMEGEAVTGQDDPMERARALAARGCDGGTIVYNIQADRLRAALIVAPEVPLQDSMAMVPVCCVGLQNALGALAPPEVAVQFTWDGAIMINGAGCGAFRVAAADPDPDTVPDWLIVGFELPVLMTEAHPGNMPHSTALYEEGCAEVSLAQLVESWARHTLLWINRWSDAGNAPLHAEWIGLVTGLGEPATQGGRTGVFLGVDDRFGMLLRDQETTHLIPMSRLLEEEI